MAEFEVSDEGRYWDSGDREQLITAFGYLDQLIKQLTHAEEVDKLEEWLGIEIKGKSDIEIGRQLKHIMPAWRQHSDHGVSAHEN
jgi:hypothetical protein